MKHNILALTIFILLFGTVAVVGQHMTGPLEGTFRANNGAKNEIYLKRITITITPGEKKFDVSGIMLWWEDGRCDIEGVYFPATGLLRANCDDEISIDGFITKVNGKYTLQITAPFAAVAIPEDDETTENTKVEGYSDAEAYSDKNAHFSLSGTWKCDDGGTYTLNQTGMSQLTWQAESSDGGVTWNHTFTGTIQGDQLNGTFQDGENGKVHNNGKLTFRIISSARIERTSTGTPFGCSILTRQY